MKKMIVFLLATVLTVSAFAQDDQPPQQERRYQDDRYQDNRDRDWNRDRDFEDHPGYRDRNRDYFSRRELDIQIARINREYDYKISAVRNDYFMGRYKKERLIRALEEQRRDEIRRVYQRFQYGNGNQNRYGERHRRNC